MPRLLDSGEKHFLRLIHQGQKCPDGWAKVSDVLYPLVDKLPKELVECHQDGASQGRARLTKHGEAIVEAMSWL